MRRWLKGPLATRSSGSPPSGGVFASQRPTRRRIRRQIQSPVDPLAGVKSRRDFSVSNVNNINTHPLSGGEGVPRQPFVRPSTDAEWQSFHAVNEAGLQRAKASEEGYFNDGQGKLFVAGTRGIRDVMDWPRIPLGKFRGSKIYKNAELAFKGDKSIDMVIGHSAGGTAALELEKNYPDRQITTVTYNSPVFSPGDPKVWGDGLRPLRFATVGDPASIFDINAQSSFRAPDFNVKAIADAVSAYTNPSIEAVAKVAQHGQFDPLLGLHSMASAKGSYSTPSGPMDYLKSAAEGAAVGTAIGVF